MQFQVDFNYWHGQAFKEEMNVFSDLQISERIRVLV